MGSVIHVQKSQLTWSACAATLKNPLKFSASHLRCDVMCALVEYVTIDRALLDREYPIANAHMDYLVVRLMQLHHDVLCIKVQTIRCMQHLPKQVEQCIHATYRCSIHTCFGDS